MPTPSASTARRVIVWAALVGGLVRAAFGIGYWHGKPLTHDEREYLSLAANLAAGRGFTQTLPEDEDASAAGAADRNATTADRATTGAPSVPRVQRFGRAPLYPLFIAPFTWLDADLRAGRMPADVPWAIKIAQAIVGALGVWLIGAIAARLAGDRAGAWAAVIAACYPPLVWTAAFALSEALYSTLALAAVRVLGAALDLPAARRKEGTALAGGVLTGLAVLTRPAMLFFLPFALLLASRRRPALAAYLLAGALLIVLPWTARNALTYHRFVLVASEGGVTFWTGNHPDAQGEGDLAANPHLKLRNLDLRARHPGLTEEELESIYYREAFTFIRTHPRSWLVLLAKKLFYTVVPIGPSYRLHSPRYFWASVLSYGATLPFAVAGVIWLWRAGRRPWALWSLAASALVVCVIFFPQERFRIPVLDPTLIICAAAWLARPRQPSATRR